MLFHRLCLLPHLQHRLDHSCIKHNININQPLIFFSRTKGFQVLKWCRLIGDNRFLQFIPWLMIGLLPWLLLLNLLIWERVRQKRASKKLFHTQSYLQNRNFLVRYCIYRKKYVQTDRCYTLRYKLILTQYINPPKIQN